jgi:DNA adenine methylase
MVAINSSVRPFVKWAGGKQALAKKLIEYFPDKFNTYYEPFVGGGSVFLTYQPEDAVIADYNNWLIDTYKAIRDDWKKVAKKLEKMPNTKEGFLKIRSICPSKLNLTERAAHFIYLNKTCFRGLFRVNREGQFNVPYGEYDRRYFDPDNLNSASIMLKNVSIRTGDFETCLHDVSKRDFIYFDPPYYKFGGYSEFNRYTKLQFKENDQIRLAALCREFDKKSILWALSNSNTTFIRKLYNGYTIHEINARREINLSSQNRNIKELLITNY